MRNFNFRNYFLPLTVLFALASLSAFSEYEIGGRGRNDSKNFSYGAKAGLNVSTLTGEKSSSKVGFTLGGFGMIKFGSDVGLAAELLYSQQGCDFTGSDVTVKLDYLNIPILAYYYIKQVEGLSAKIGIQPSLLLSSNVDYGHMSYTDGFNTLDVAIPVGISYEFAFGLLFDARYNIGITNVFDGTWKFNNKDSGNNMVFKFTAGYRY
jgi:hypothetical protein